VKKYLDIPLDSRQDSEIMVIAKSHIENLEFTAKGRFVGITYLAICDFATD